MRFHWAFVAYPNPETHSHLEPQPIERDTVLYSGDYFKLLLEPLTECYAYFLYDSKEELKILFPYNQDQFETDWEVGEQYYIPKGRNWYRLDETTGQEKLHLLVSRERLIDLERLIDSFRAAGKDEKEALGLKVLNKLNEVRKRLRMHRTIVDRPEPIAGTMRGGDEEEVPTTMPPLVDVAKYAKVVEADTFYSKTLVITHQ